MATLQQVLNAVATLIDQTIYPNGDSQPSAVTAPVFTAVGWPEETKLINDVTAGGVDITIFAPPGMEKMTTRYPRVWVDQTIVTPTLAATVNGSTVTIGGTVTATHYVSIVVDNQGFSYAALATDTLSTIASQLVSQMPASLNASVNGAVITIGTRTDIVARVAAPGTVMMEVGRQMRKVCVTIWAPSPQLRDAVDAVIGPVLHFTTFLTLADTTSAWINYTGTHDIDDGQKAGYYRRDLDLMIEYPTIQTMPGYPITIARDQLATVTDVTVLQQDT